MIFAASAAGCLKATTVNHMINRMTLHLICMRSTCQLAASKRYKQTVLQTSVWAKTFLDLAEELRRIFFAQKQLHFVLQHSRTSTQAIFLNHFMNEISIQRSKSVPFPILRF